LTDIATLQQRLETLREARASTAVRVEIEDRALWLKTDAELAAAITAVQQEIADASAPVKRNVVVRGLRGW
jgi:hypothetical protein